MLDESIAAVREENLTSESEIRTDHMNRLRISNYIPPRAEEMYAVALMEEYHKALPRNEDEKMRTG
jgi:hypothetical protein